MKFEVNFAQLCIRVTNGTSPYSDYMLMDTFAMANEQIFNCLIWILRMKSDELCISFIVTIFRPNVDAFGGIERPRAKPCCLNSFPPFREIIGVLQYNRIL